MHDIVRVSCEGLQILKNRTVGTIDINMLKTIAALGDLLRRSKRAYNYFYDESRISVMIEFVLYCCSKSWQYDKDLISLAALLRTRHGKFFQVKILSNWFILFIKFSLNNHRYPPTKHLDKHVLESSIRFLTRARAMQASICKKWNCAFKKRIDSFYLFSIRQINFYEYPK